MRLRTICRSSVFFRTGLILILFAGLWGEISAHAAPSAFSLISPANGAEVSGSVLLDWEDSTDPDAEGLTYTIYLSEGNDSFVEPIRIEGIRDSTRLLKEADGIEDLRTYYWKVKAISDFGEEYETAAWQFKTDNNANPVPAWIGGYVKAPDNKPIPNATIKVVVWNQEFQFTTDSKGYFLGQLTPGGQINPGLEEDIKIEINAEGYKPVSNDMKVTVGDVTTAEPFTLDIIGNKNYL